MTLEVQIISYGAEGLKRVGEMTLPEVAGVRYFVSFQNPERQKYDIPASISTRKDVEVYEHFTKGSNINRNVAMSRGDSDLILFADDDLHYSAQGLKAVIAAFEKDSELDYATFMHTGGDNKWFPDYEFDLGQKEPKGYYMTAFELAVRRRSLPKDMRYSAHFGLGMPVFGTGDDSVFFLRLQKSKLKGRFFPIVIVHHPNITTGNRKATPTVLRTQGAYIRLKYGTVEGLLRLLRDVPRRNASLWSSFYHMMKGFVLIPKYLNQDGTDR